MQSVVDVIGMAEARDLWVLLIQHETQNPKELQWLAVLACM